MEEGEEEEAWIMTNVENSIISILQFTSAPSTNKREQMSTFVCMIVNDQNLRVRRRCRQRGHEDR